MVHAKGLSAVSNPTGQQRVGKKTAGRHMYICMYECIHVCMHECINVCVCVSMAANVVPQVRYYKSRRKEDGLKSLFLNSSPDFLLLHVFMMSRCHG